MATQMIQTNHDDIERCHKCRYWFDRCCHALAMLEGTDKCPMTCVHFIAVANSPPQWLEAAS